METGSVVRVKGEAVRQAWRGRPWIAKEAVVAFEGGGASDAPFVDLIDENALPLGTALYDPDDDFPLRLLSSARTTDPVALIRTRLERAEARRRTDLLGADAYRLCHGEGDGVPRLFVDRFGRGLCVTSTSDAMSRVAPELIANLVETTGAEAVVHYQPTASVRDSLLPTRLRKDAPFVGQLVHGAHSRVRFHHGGLVRTVDISRGFEVTALTAQLDSQRYVRRWARGHVLDVYAGMGGYGLQLADAGASRTLLVDEDDDMLASIDEDAKNNGIGSKVETRRENPLDAMRKLDRAGERFQMVCVHPTEIRETKEAAQTAQQRVFERLRAALKLLDEGGIFIAWPGTTALDASAFERTLVDAATRGRKRLQVIARLGAGPDHPTLVGTEDPAAPTLVARVLSTT